MPQREKSIPEMSGRVVFISFFLISVGVNSSCFADQRPLQKLLSLALENSPNILNAKRTLETSRLERANATAALLPSLDFDASHGISDLDPRPPGKTNPWASELRLGLSETLYDNGDSITKRNIALRKEQRAELEFALAKDAALTTVAEAYFRWSSAVQSLKIQEEQRDAVDRQFKLIRNQYRQGVRSRRDVLRIETQARSNEIQRIQAENAIQIAELDLAKEVGISLARFQKENIAPYSVPRGWTPPQLPAPVELRTHAKVKALDLAVQEADLEASRVTREYWPRLSLDGAVAYNASGYMGNGLSPSDTDFVDWRAMLNLKYNLWDFGIRSRNSQIARIEAGRVRESHRGEVLGLENTVRSQYILLKESRDNIQLTKELLDIEAQSFAAQEMDYRNGKATFLDLSTALRSLVEAKVQFNSNFFEFKKQQVNYAYHQGRVQEFYLAQ